jgi:SsrA-binding protein
MKIITQNKKAFFDYQVLNQLEAGIVLTGDEVKSIRAGHISLAGSFAHIREGELYLINCNITPYDKAYQKKEDTATRSRKLLVHRRELERLIGDISRKGIMVVPLKVYINEKGLIKVALGMCKSKKMADKRESIKEREGKREAARAMKYAK